MGDEATSIEAAGGYGNKVLYRMCSEEPFHNNREIVRSKARVIAKTYEVSRNLGGDYDIVAEALCSRKLDLDWHLSQLADSEFTEASLPFIVSTHGRTDRAICKRLKKVAGGRNVHSRASFVSKYLHFHCPSVFPILDSLAEAGIRLKVNEKMPKAEFAGEHVSERYERFCRAMRQLMESEKYGGMSLRQIDTYLVQAGRDKRERGGHARGG